MSSQPAARTPGAKRAGAGEHLFDLASINHIKGGPDYSSVEGGVVEGDRMIVALMRMPAGTGAETHSHPNEQWIYILEGTFEGRSKANRSRPSGHRGHVPANALHSGKATKDRDVCFHLQGCLAQSTRHQGCIERDMKRLAFALLWVSASRWGRPAARAQSAAQAWPTRPIRDSAVCAGHRRRRCVASGFPPAFDQLGQQIVVENRSGAGGTIGAAAVAKADPDSYTILGNRPRIPLRRRSIPT